MKNFAIGALALAAIAGSASAATRNIDFDTDALGNTITDLTTVSTQYAAWGVNFTPNAFAGGSWASNTGMTATSTDVGGGYNASLGNVLHAFNVDWLTEDGDPSFLISFSTGITSFEMDVIGDTGGVDGLQTFVALFAADGTTLIDFFDASGIGGVERIGGALSGTAFFAAVAHGDFNDWVGIDNITYTEVIPAPASLGLLGLAGLVAGRRRR